MRELFIRREILTDALRTMINNSFKVFQKNNSFKKSFIIKEKE